jgi:hypothetical protein
MAGVRVQAGDVADRLGSYGLAEPVGLDRRSSIEPDDRRRKRPIGTIHRDDPVNLGRDRDGGHGISRDTCRRDGVADGRPNAGSPIEGILLGPARLWRRERIRRARPAGDRAGLVDDEGLRALRSDITPDDVDDRAS